MPGCPPRGAQWIESGVSPKSNIAGLQMRVGAASSARFDTLEASERAALIGTAKSQRLDEVLKAFGSMSHIKDELDISLGTAKTLWLAIMGANAEAQIATMRHMQCVVEAIQSDLRWMEGMCWHCHEPATGHSQCTLIETPIKAECVSAK